MGKEAKTNAMRILEREKVPYTAHEYAHEEGVAVAGVDVAGSMGEDPACVYKTLVTQGSSKNYFVFVIPVAAELDLKAAARSGRKERGHDPCSRHQQGHRLCARRLQPRGHEEAVQDRVRRECPRTGKSVCFRRAHRHPGVLCSGGPHPRRPRHHGKDHLLNRAEKYVF